MPGTIVKCLCWKDRNGKCIGGSAMHTPIKKNWLADDSFDWSDYEMAKFTFEELQEDRLQTGDPRFQTSRFWLVWLEVLSTHFWEQLEQSSSPRKASWEPQVTQYCPGRALHCWNRAQSEQGEQNRDNDSKRYFQCSSDHGTSWCGQSGPKQNGGKEKWLFVNS